MITTIADFQSTYSVKDGEIASAETLSRPTTRLKYEINELDLITRLLMGDISLVPEWVSGYNNKAGYEKGVLVKKTGVVYRSLVNANTVTPGTDALKWEDLTALLAAFSGLISGNGSGDGSILEFANRNAFPSIGESATLYIDLSSGVVYRWTGATYSQISASSSGSDEISGPVVYEAFTAGANQSVFTVLGELFAESMIFIEGVLQDPTSYTINTVAKTVTLTAGQPAGTRVVILAISEFNSDNFLATAGGAMTGPITSLREVAVNVPAGVIDLATGNLFTKTISENVSFSLSNIPSSGSVFSFIVELTNGGAFTVGWFSNVKWASGIAPTLTSSGKDVLAFYTHDAGLTFVGMLLAKDVK